MAITRKVVKGRVIVRGIDHGHSGYNNHGCRCETCIEANAAHSREYRNRRFAGNPMCRVPKCPRVQSRAYGNGFCYRHAQDPEGAEAEIQKYQRALKRKRALIKKQRELIRAQRVQKKTNKRRKVAA